MNDTSNTIANPVLSDMERNIVLELAQGKSIKEIARAVFLSQQSVFQYLSRARRKTNARTTYQLIYLVCCGAHAQHRETQHASTPNQPNQSSQTRSP